MWPVDLKVEELRHLSPREADKDVEKVMAPIFIRRMFFKILAQLGGNAFPIGQEGIEYLQHAFQYAEPAIEGHKVLLAVLPQLGQDIFYLADDTLHFIILYVGVFRTYFASQVLL
ncbi:hypothetical protein PG999_004011 [Apiospora kogelbergensis]|uniref:Uncharacterized protein n=1 Tax=Apiospora kogelbergensis TaxID=1337665 RepID=A0AAW0R522_9PEZI